MEVYSAPYILEFNQLMNIEIENLDGGNLRINSEYRDLLLASGIDSAGKLWNLQSESVKNIRKERGTDRVWLVGQSGEKIETFIKRYQPVSFREWLKNAFSLKFTHFDAWHEWESIIAFHRNGLSTAVPLAVGRNHDGTNCILTLGITGYTRASDLFEKFGGDEIERKEYLIDKLAVYAGTMHKAGMAHQDFYLVHFFIREQDKDAVYLIDLQRVILQQPLRERWIVKDLGQLLFSARNVVTDNEIQCFREKYEEVRGEKLSGSLVASIARKAAKITARDARKSQ